MARYKFEFLALTPEKKKITICLETESALTGWKEIHKEFNIYLREKNTYMNANIPEIIKHIDDPIVSECKGCETCKDG